MNDTYSQISELSKSQKEKRSTGKKTNLSEFYRRNDTLNTKKKQLYQFGEEQKFEEEKQNINYLRTVRYYRPTPFEAPKKTNSIWDEDGNLIQENIQSNKAIKKEDNENINYKKSKTEVTREDFSQFLQRNQGQANNVKKQECQKTVPQNKNNFNSFLKRQEESFKNRNKKHPLPKQKSFINKKSSELAMKASKKVPNKNDSEELEEYSFHPDMSKTLNHKVNKLPVELAEAQLVLKNIEIEKLKMEIDAQKKKDSEISSGKKKQSKKGSKKSDTHPNIENFEKNNMQSLSKLIVINSNAFKLL